MKPTPVKTALLIGVLLIALASWLETRLPVDHPKWHNRYDHQYKKHAKHYFSVLFDWRWFKAQGIAESGLRKHARSTRGALGVMQILPTTFNEIFEDPALLPGITEPRWNIAAAIAYDRYLYDRWSQYIPRSERLPFALASYNAGFSRTMEARGLAKASGHDPRKWQQVSKYVPLQTKNYVSKIFRLMEEPG